jgi:hypothetical protein
MGDNSQSSSQPISDISSPANSKSAYLSDISLPITQHHYIYKTLEYSEILPYFPQAPKIRSLHYSDYRGDILYSYNIFNSSIQTFNSSEIDQDFQNITLWSIDYHNILTLYGLWDIDSYVLNSSSRRSISIPNLNKIAYEPCLYSHSDYIYFFGGRNGQGIKLSSVARYNLTTNRLQRLESMKYARIFLSCVGIRYLIYLFHGSSKNIEIFNTRTLNFREAFIQNYENAVCHGIAALLGNEIYLVTTNFIQIYDTALTQLGYIPIQGKLQEPEYGILSPIITLDHTIFFCRYDSGIEKIDLNLLQPPKPRSIDHFSKHLNGRYIYSTYNEHLLRIDIKYNTTHTFKVFKYYYQSKERVSYRAICELSRGRVFIYTIYSTGGKGACVIYDTINQKTIKISKVKAYRKHAGWIFHQESLYAFGCADTKGKACKRVERFRLNVKQFNDLTFSFKRKYKLTQEGWDELPYDKREELSLECEKWVKLDDMISERISPSCVGIGNQIFIIGGGIGTIEIFDIKTQTYQLSSFKLHSCFHINTISVVIDERIYIVSQNNYLVLNSDLVVLHQSPNPSEDKYTTKQSTLGVYKGKIKCMSNMELIESYDINSLRRTYEIVQFTSLHQASKDNNPNF